MNKNSIKARVLQNWTHKNSKFLPGEYCQVDFQDQKHDSEVCKAYSYSQDLVDYIGLRGKVIAVSATKAGKIRSCYGSVTSSRQSNRYYVKLTRTSSRQFTRYYVEFKDGRVFGIHSHHLVKLG